MNTDTLGTGIVVRDAPWGRTMMPDNVCNVPRDRPPGKPELLTHLHVVCVIFENFHLLCLKLVYACNELPKEDNLFLKHIYLVTGISRYQFILLNS